MPGEPPVEWLGEAAAEAPAIGPPDGLTSDNFAPNASLR